MNLPPSEVLADPSILETVTREIFERADADHSSQIDRLELKAEVRRVSTRLESEAVQNEIVQEIIVKYDTDHSGQLSYEEFTPYVHDVLASLAEEEAET